MIQSPWTEMVKYQRLFRKNTEPGQRVKYAMHAGGLHGGGRLIVGKRIEDASGNVVEIITEPSNLGLAGVPNKRVAFHSSIAQPVTGP